MTTRLRLYNAALLECGERSLASLTEEREPRRLLDQVWDEGAIRYCLAKRQWGFATRTQQLDPTGNITPAFGYKLAYEVPADLVRTTALCSDEYMQTPLLAYVKEGAYWYSDTQPIYVSFVSDDAAYGGDLAQWPEDFSRVVALYMASRIVVKLTQDENKKVAMLKELAMLTTDASSSDAMEGPTRFPPSGSWVRARVTGRPGDRGSRNKLLG